VILRVEIDGSIDNLIHLTIERGAKVPFRAPKATKTNTAYRTDPELYEWNWSAGGSHGTFTARGSEDPRRLAREALTGVLVSERVGMSV
jgi:hypothetical protein